MRIAPALALFATIASPALAAPAHRPTPEQAVRLAQEPVVQDAAAATLVQLADIILDTRVGPAAMLADPHGDVRPTDTLRDLKEREDPRFEQHLRAETRRAVGTAATVAGGAAMQAGEIRRTADRLQAALAPLMGALNGAGHGEADGD